MLLGREGGVMEIVGIRKTTNPLWRPSWSTAVDGPGHQASALSPTNYELFNFKKGE